MIQITHVIQELRPTLKLALPMILGQVSQMLIGITNAALIGRVGTIELAAAAFTNGVFGLCFIVGIGLLIPVSVLIARDYGAGDDRGCIAWLHHGQVLALGYGLLALLIQGLIISGINLFALPIEVIAVMKPFFILNALSIIPVMYFQAQRQYLDAMNRPWVGSAVMFIDVLLNLLLSSIFIWGYWIIPAMGLTGSGVATLIARSIAVLVLSFWLQRTRLIRAPLIAHRFRELLRFGIPSASSLLFEAGAFTSAMIMMGWLSATALAAHQIALTCAAFTFMFPLGLSMALGIRIGRARGELLNTHHAEPLRIIAFGGFAIGILMMTLFALLFMFAGHTLASAFTPDIAVIELTAKLLIVAAIFQLFDGGQVMAFGALRGLTDMRVPTLITFVAYWLLALPIGYLLAFKFGLGAIGVWSGLAVGLGIAAVLLLRRFAFLTQAIK